MFACGQPRGDEPLGEPAGADVADDGVHVADEEQEAEVVRGAREVDQRLHVGREDAQHRLRREAERGGEAGELDGHATAPRVAHQDERQLVIRVDLLQRRQGPEHGVLHPERRARLQLVARIEHVAASASEVIEPRLVMDRRRLLLVAEAVEEDDDAERVATARRDHPRLVGALADGRRHGGDRSG